MPHGFDLILTLTGGLSAALVCGLITQRLGLSPIVGYLLAGDRRRPVHARLRRQQRHRGTAGRNRRRAADVRRRPAVSCRGAARRPARGRAGRDRPERGRHGVGRVVARALGWAWAAAMVFGCRLSVASTVVLIRVLADNGDLHTPTGHIAVGWLVVEDLFTVLVLVLLPPIFGQCTGDRRRQSAWLLGVTLLKVAALVVAYLRRRHARDSLAARRVAGTQLARAVHADGAALALGIAVGVGRRLRRVDGPRRVSRRHGRRPIRLQPARGVRRAADARCLRRALLRVGRDAARSPIFSATAAPGSCDAGRRARRQAARGAADRRGPCAIRSSPP